MSFGDLPLGVEYSKSGAPRLASERFTNCEEARGFCAAMVGADYTRSMWRARVENILNGARPIDEAKLKENRLSWYPNANYRGLEGYIDAPRTAFYDLVTEVDPCIEVRLDYGTGKQRTSWEETIAKHFTWLMLGKWRRGFNYHVPLHQREMLVHGLGAHVWPQMNTANWIPRTPQTGLLLFPEGTSSDFENEGEAFLLRDFVPLHQMYQFIKNEDAARALGWNPDAVWKAMASSSKLLKQPRFDLEAWKRAEKRGDRAGSMSRTSGIWVHWLFVKELDTGRISLYALADGVEGKDYIFKKRNLYEDWPLCLFPYDIGNGDLQSIRGLGQRCKDFFELDNQIKNSMAAQVLLGNTIPLKQTGSIDPSKLKLTKMGMMSILPQNVEIAAGFRFPDLSQGPIALSRELQSTLRANNESYISGSPDAKDRETATSYLMRSQDSAQITKGTHGLYGSHLCLFYEKTFNMVVKASKRAGAAPQYTMAREFMRRCERDGVPKEAFEHVEEIIEVVSTGAGSAAARIQGLERLMQLVFPFTTDDRKTNILRDYTSAIMSGAKVDRYAPSLDDEDTSDSDDSIITLENNDMSQGQQATVTDQNNHVRHAEGHLESASAIYQALEEEQIAPEQALGALMAHGAHVTAHLQRLAQNPTLKKEYAELKKALGQLANVTNQLRQQVEAAQESMQPSPEQQMSEQGQIGMAKVEQDAALKRAKFQADAALKFDKLRFQQRLESVKAGSQIQLNRVKTASDIRLSAVDTTASIAQSSAKARAGNGA